MGDGRVDLQGLAGDAPALGRGHGAEGAHVVQPVRELDHDDADVFHHRQHHLAEVLRLGLGAALELDLGELGDAVHQLRHFGAEAGVDLFLQGGRVFDDIVQQGRLDGVMIHVQVGEDGGDRDRVRDVRFAGQAPLALMGDGRRTGRPG